MKSGYEVYWTKNALLELSDTFKYLESEFTDTELNNLAVEIERVTHLISINPALFPMSNFKGIRRIVVKKHNTLYYRFKNDRVEILSFFNNRKNPKNLNL